MSPVDPSIRDSGGSSGGTAGSSGGAVMETILRGTIPPRDLPKLVFLLRSLCPESGYLGEFREYDRIYHSAQSARGPRSLLRLRKHLVSSQAPTEQWARYTLAVHGIPDRRVPAPASKRPVNYVKVGSDMPEFLAAMGCAFQYEYLRKGVRFKTRQNLLVEVYMVEKPESPGNFSQGIPIMPADKHAVVDVLQQGGAAHEKVFAFMECLRPIVAVRMPDRK